MLAFFIIFKQQNLPCLDDIYSSSPSLNPKMVLVLVIWRYERDRVDKIYNREPKCRRSGTIPWVYDGKSKLNG